MEVWFPHQNPVVAQEITQEENIHNKIKKSHLAEKPKHIDGHIDTNLAQDCITGPVKQSQMVQVHQQGPAELGVPLPLVFAAF